MRGAGSARVCLQGMPDLWLGTLRMTATISEPSLFELRPPTTGSEELPIIDERRRGTKFVELPCTSIINTPESTNMEFWSVNPYVGCEFGCSYCYARFAHNYVVDRARSRGRLSVPLGLEPFEQRIFVKRRSSVLRALDTDLRKLRRRTVRHGTQTLLIGSGTDPYQPAERLYQITRTILERLRAERGIRIGIITKSPLVCRDIDLLRALGRRNLVSVYISLISADINIIKQFEARSPMPHVRLRALDKLTRNGIRAGLLVAPILPGITDTTQQLELLMSEARDAGAHFAHPVPLRMYNDTRERVFPILAEAYPQLVARYHANYDKDRNVPDTYFDALRTRFRDIGQRFGIEDTGTERDYTKAPKRPSTQLTLWES